MQSRTQQSELWIYLAVTWWIGSLVAWLIAWFSHSTIQPNDSVLTATGLLMFGVSACIRLPVLTSKTPTTALEDHFVWLLSASANVNWLGYLGLHASTLSAVLPVALVGLVGEWWLWNQANKLDCLTWARTNLIRLVSAWRSQSGIVIKPTTIPSGNIVDVTETEVDSCQDRNVVHRTVEDGIDPTGHRYLAGEVLVDWLPEQRSQAIVIGFVPAFQGQPQVEIELGCDQCTAQIVNLTPVGLRIQLKRSFASSEHATNLSWYAKQVSIDGRSDVAAGTSQSQTLA